ncbi:MAG: hypothetical protein ACFFCC_15025 [Promethearchaeota archaeon]
MILNDLKVKVDGSFSREIVIDDDGEELVYIFPDTNAFISVLKRKVSKEVLSE